MNEEKLRRLIDSISPLDEAAMAAAQHRLDQLTKPPGSLGKLEHLARQLAGITGEITPSLDKKAVIVMAGDHGVCEEGVSAFPQEVTAQMVNNFVNGGAAVNVLARQAGADVVCVNAGVKTEMSHPRLLDRNVRRGTGNIARGPAMSRGEALQAIGAGAAIVEELHDQGYSLLATGEMGIGNTTASAALMTVLAGVDPERAAGRGTGIDDAALRRKIEVIRRAVQVNRPDASDPLDVLAKVGGLEIAGLVGVILGCAARRLPVVLDGFISTAAALVAFRLAPAAKPFMIASHLSQENGHVRLLEELGLTPLIHLDMRLGEGTGAALCFPIIDAALSIMKEMATFESAGVSRKDETGDSRKDAEA